MLLGRLGLGIIWHAGVTGSNVLGSGIKPGFNPHFDEARIDSGGFETRRQVGIVG